MLLDLQDIIYANLKYNPTFNHNPFAFYLFYPFEAAPLTSQK
jgi:hypothetical protein